MKLDLHVHTHYSIDSLIDPPGLIRKSNQRGVIPAITDHNTIEAHVKLRAIGAKFIPGEEIRTDRGDLIGLYLTQNIERLTPFAEAIDKIHEQGGLAYLPHMYDKSRHGVIPSKLEAKKIDIIEVFNARCPLDSFNQRAQAYSESNGLHSAIGSDSHFLFEFGKSFNEVPDFDIDNPRALLKSLKRAKFVTKRAPLFVRGTTTFVAFGKKLIRRLRL